MSDDPATPEELNARIQALRAEEPASQNDETRRQSGVMMRIASDLVAGALVGAGMGYFLDQWLETKPIFLLICFGFGMAAAFRNIYRIMMKDAEKPLDSSSPNFQKKD